MSNGLTTTGLKERYGPLEWLYEESQRHKATLDRVGTEVPDNMEDFYKKMNESEYRKDIYKYFTEYTPHGE